MNYSGFGKRLIDLVFSLIMLGTLLPVFLILLVVLAVHFRGSPFFFQERPGKNGKTFKIIKFRTMADVKGNGALSDSDEMRITTLGKIIRTTSLDEIPQLLNVLKGDMSLVGPRPLLVEYLPLYNDSQARRHDLRPGVTGWAQVNGRNAISWERKFDFDVWYVDHVSLYLDLKILGITVWNVLRRSGISQPGHITVGKFNGSGSPD